MAPLPFLTNLFTRSSFAEPLPFSPLEVSNVLRVRDIGKSPVYNPGTGAWNPSDINNTGFFVLFALIGVAFVIASIWFFFWAKNGGFHWRKRDWDDYKSTVLRRKGPDGKTLSNATKSTRLGGGSVVGSAATEETTSYRDKGETNDGRRKERRRNGERKHNRHNKEDKDVRAYREEKPAKVGGLNRAPDGVYSTTQGSDTASQGQPMSEIHRSHRQPESRTRGPHTPRRHRDFSYAPASEATFSVASDDSHRPLTQASPASPSPRRNRASQPSSPTKQRASAAKDRYTARPSQSGRGYYATRASEGSYADPIDFSGGSRYQNSNSAASVAQVENTKAYKHTIPGLSKGPAAVGNGFRRGGGRRDSLSDSDGETDML